jgi:hypothetical protein
MQIISLKTFAQTGKFGPVEVGMSKDAVIALLGEPDGDNDFGAGYSGLCYSWYELFYMTKTKQITAIQNDHLQARHSDHHECICFKNDNFEIDPWFLEVGKNISYKEVILILRREDIAFEVARQINSEILKLESGVTMDFEDHSTFWLLDEQGAYYSETVMIDDPQEYVLNGIRYFPKK